MLVRSPAPSLVLVALIGLTGCVAGPFISKSNTGNLEIHVSAPPGVDVSRVRLYIDDHYIGNVSRRSPVLFVNRGERTVRAELDGFPVYEEKLQILGDPNHQVLNIDFKSP